MDGVALGAVVGSATATTRRDDDVEAATSVADGDGVVAAGPEPARWSAGPVAGPLRRASASFAGPRAGTGRTAPT